MFSAIERLKRKMSCSMIEICRRSVSRFQSRTSTPSIVIAPSIGVVDAVDQLGDRALARTRLPDQRQRLPGASVKETSPAHSVISPSFISPPACTES
jgi:hypothetical protein